ncbi:hypothetical protein EYB26_008074 [Talaromyces marneffei]|uniref:uncharacterized protein n=1 Tax=Talaromyces marneffei TaxID=37727 RepID=UPI0012AA4506|nr:uncharacterized protein EYB26_008074 [Talaromyces marneffei]QGA20372.1 hypothetical protein EYB26_008074 [Talaromyces marneffei]
MAATENAGSMPPTFEMLHNVAKEPMFRRTTIARPRSEATEIFDTDFESDYDDILDSPRRSVGSLVAESVTTVSTRDVPTPDSAAMASYQFEIDGKTVRGPQGPHLFRSSMSSDEFDASYEVDFVLAKTPTKAAFDRATINPETRKDTPLPGFVDDNAPTYVPHAQLKSISLPVSAPNEANVRSWSPPDVVRWMQDVGFDDSIIEKFFVNDISGAILLDLQSEDLKELEIKSFGKRRHLMNSIQHLRESVRFSTPGVPLASTLSQNVSSDCLSSSDSGTTPTQDSDKHKKNRRRHHRSHKKESGLPKDLIPDDSASIVAIEQVLPKPHHCSKGEDCRKWQKQQRKISRLAKDLPLDIAATTRFIHEPDNEHRPPHTAKSLPNMEPMPTPSIVASSDILGPEQMPQFHLSEAKLNELRQRDPQENVRQYLNLQHLSRLQPVRDSNGSRPGPCASPDVDSPDSTRTTASLADNLRTLPKLTIPTSHHNGNGAYSANLSAQRTVTPSILRKQPNFVTGSIDATLYNAQEESYMYEQGMTPADYVGSPSDFYRTHELYRQSTPFSEVDVPITAIPDGPIEREISQSVPPDMRFGREHLIAVDPIARPASTRHEHYRRRPSIVAASAQTLYPVAEVVGPIDTLDDLNATSRVTPGHIPDATHSGWMKKRKTTRMLKHEWEDHHFTLKGTRLAMFGDEEASRRDSRALECIDVDDYAVACSSLASSSKLTAAFKKTVLKRRDSAQNEAAFAFSLIPSTNGNASAVERKNFFLSNGKSHHFAVKTRDERIDWMRELMLAKALKRGKESGDSVHVNGQLF